MAGKKGGATADMSGCRGCRHYFEAADPGCYRQSIPACVYILNEGRRRPCPPGPAPGDNRVLCRRQGAALKRYGRCNRALIKRHYHLADPPELISGCLGCEKSECTNCLERKLKAAGKKSRPRPGRGRAQSSTATPGRRK